MSNELLSLSDIFKDKLFRIPDYQRGYAWTKEQLAAFWDDIINLQSGRYHYAGLLSLKVLQNDIDTEELKSWGNDRWMIDAGYKPCHVVDGQQRLTTFIILINEMISFVRNLDVNKGRKDNEIYLEADISKSVTLKAVTDKYIYQVKPPMHIISTFIFGYENDNPSSEYLKYKILGQPCSKTIQETYYTKNLEYAKNFFDENLRVLYHDEGMDGINSLYQKLTLHVMFNIHEISNDYDVFVAFETMNSRGKKLTNLEILKNRLIYLSTIFPCKDGSLDAEKNAIRKQINDAWKEIYFQLGRNKDASLSDDDFLRTHWIIYYTYTRRKGDDYIRYLLEKFSPKRIYHKKAILTNFHRTEISENLDNEEDNSEDEPISNENDTLLTLNEISEYVLSLSSMAKFWYYTFFPYESDRLSDEEKSWIEKLNRLGMGYYRPIVTVVLSKNYTIDERVEIFKLIEKFIFVLFRMGNYNASYRSSAYYRDVHKIYENSMELHELKDDMVARLKSEIPYAIKNFVTKIDKCFSDGDGYYHWSSLKYFLYEYEISLSAKNRINRMSSWKLFTTIKKDSVSIEHILPQTSTKKYWTDHYKQFSDEQIKILTGALGNLLPLSQPINSGLQNDSFYDKKTSKDGRRGYENGCHSEIEVSKSADWTAIQIYERSEKLLAFLEERWQITFEEKQLKDLIHLDFVKDKIEISTPLPENDAV